LICISSPSICCGYGYRSVRGAGQRAQRKGKGQWICRLVHGNGGRIGTVGGIVGNNNGVIARRKTAKVQRIGACSGLWGYGRWAGHGKAVGSGKAAYVIFYGSVITSYTAYIIDQCANNANGIYGSNSMCFIIGTSVAIRNPKRIGVGCQV